MQHDVQELSRVVSVVDTVLFGNYMYMYIHMYIVHVGGTK